METLRKKGLVIQTMGDGSKRYKPWAQYSHGPTRIKYTLAHEIYSSGETKYYLSTTGYITFDTEKEAIWRLEEAIDRYTAAQAKAIAKKVIKEEEKIL